MKLIWQVDKQDIERVRSFVSENHNEIVAKRQRLNIQGKGILITKDTVLKSLTMCLLTSRQKSGPESPIIEFLTQKPFSLTYNRLKNVEDIEEYVKSVLNQSGLKRFINRVPKFFTNNFEKFESSNWAILTTLNKLVGIDSRILERQIAEELHQEIKGFGPKQSRNFLQSLGLIKYEIPIDSRTISWLDSFNFPMQVNSTAISNQYHYNLVLDGIQFLCRKSNIYPCILDASIFGSFDNSEWSSDKIIF